MCVCVCVFACVRSRPPLGVCVRAMTPTGCVCSCDDPHWVCAFCDAPHRAVISGPARAGAAILSVALINSLFWWAACATHRSALPHESGLSATEVEESIVNDVSARCVQPVQICSRYSRHAHCVAPHRYLVVFSGVIGSATPKTKDSVLDRLRILIIAAVAQTFVDVYPGSQSLQRPSFLMSLSQVCAAHTHGRQAGRL